jgi:hypothetical protein
VCDRKKRQRERAAEGNRFCCGMERSAGGRHIVDEQDMPVFACADITERESASLVREPLLFCELGLRLSVCLAESACVTAHPFRKGGMEKHLFDLIVPAGAQPL